MRAQLCQLANWQQQQGLGKRAEEKDEGNVVHPI
jgi:hypothetical protein